MTNILAHVMRWLRAGYPEGGGWTGYQPLLALLPQRLTDAQVIDLGHELAASGRTPADHIDISVGITRVTDVLPTPDEVDRVAVRLRDAGFAVEDPRLVSRPHRRR